MAGHPVRIARHDETKPDYEVSPERLAEWRAARHRPPSTIWCNVCNAGCESEEVLRAHYREEHPELAARLEAQRTRLPD